MGNKVAVYLQDGKEVEGRVASNQDGVLVVTITDNKYEVGEKVTVKTVDDDRIGSGELYIYSQWNATAYSGTIYDIQVRENEKVAAGRLMFLLKDSGNTAQFQRLVDQRQQYEELMHELFTMYQTEKITSPCDGIVSGLDENGTYLLAQKETGLVAQLLSFLIKDDKAGFNAFAVQVGSVNENGMTLKIDPASAKIEDLTKLAQMTVNMSAMTQNWNYVGDTTVYTQDADGMFREAGIAEAGDLLLMVGNEDAVCWFVKLSDSNKVNDVKSGRGIFDVGAKKETENNSVKLVMMSDESFWENDSWNEDSGDSENGHHWGPGNWPWPDFNPDSDDDENGDEEETPDQGETPPDEGETPPDQGGENPPSDGTQEPETTQSYRGYLAKITEISAGSMTVMQEPQNTYNIRDLENIPSFTANESQLTEEKSYTSDLITEEMAAAGDIVLIIVDAEGTLVQVAKQTSAGASGGNAADGMPGTEQGGSGMPAGGSMPGGTKTQTPAFEPYTLEKLTVASVTSQEHMTVAVTIDELEISRIFMGQTAVVSVDALGGEQFDAAVTKISNSGTNEGGNSKFTVELTLSRSGEMIPGMYSSAVITLKEHDAVLAVPVAALDKIGRNTVVYTSYHAEDGTLGDPVVVTTGASDGENVQILSGLSQGQKIYYAYYDTYIDSEESDAAGISFGMMGRRR